MNVAAVTFAGAVYEPAGSTEFDMLDNSGYVISYPTLLGTTAIRFQDQAGYNATVLAGDRGWTFAELDARSNAAARHLADRGVQPGTRVAVMTSNRPEFVVVVHAVSKLGAAPVLLSPAWRSSGASPVLHSTTNQSLS